MIYWIFVKTLGLSTSMENILCRKTQVEKIDCTPIVKIVGEHLGNISRTVN